GSVVGPSGGSATRSAGARTTYTPGGGTARSARATTTRTTPGGTTAARPVGGVRANNPRVGGAAATRSNYANSGRARTASRGGVAVGPNGAVAGGTRRTTVTGPRGNTATYRSTYRVSSTALRTQGGYVRAGFRGYNYFTPGWYGGYTGLWRGRWLAGV